MTFSERELYILRRTVGAFKHNLEEYIKKGNADVAIQPHELEEILNKIESELKGAAV